VTDPLSAYDRGHTEPESSAREPWGWLEAFVLIQYLSTGILLLPGAQHVRFIIRALPYLSSGALLAFYAQRSPSWKAFPGTRALILAIILLVINLLQPDTVMIAGVAQVIFTILIAAPAFWVGKVVRDKNRLDRILYLVFIANALGALVGYVQTRYGLLMPAEFSAVALGMNPDLIGALSYKGANGQTIVRPPGLSDMPGGAAGSGQLAAVLGVALALGGGPLSIESAIYLAVAAIGLATVYLTQVRSLLGAAVLGIMLAAWAASRLRRQHGMRIAFGGAGLVVAAFALAVAIGGRSITNRFATLTTEHPLETYQSNRGFFLTDTFERLLPEYPLGAGVGRWGMMRLYTDPYIDETAPPPLYVELQWTGWLFDGGFPMWILYGSAILASLAYAYKVAKRHPDREMRYLAGLVFALNMMVFLMIFDGPPFNTQMGIQFWTLTGALAGACEGYRLKSLVEPAGEDAAARYPDERAAGLYGI
jgi:hypothetical protein